jgi:hypothetical protein
MSGLRIMMKEKTLPWMYLLDATNTRTLHIEPFCQPVAATVGHTICRGEPEIGIGMGNPGVEKGYPYPNPEIPLPSMPGRGILGLGSQVPLVLSFLCQVVRKPGILSWVNVEYQVS